MTVTIINNNPVTFAVPVRSPLVVRPLYGPGAKGEQGDTGPPGPAGEGGFDFIQPTPVSSVTINHNLGRRTVVDVYALGGIKLGCEVQHLNLNQVLVTFNTPQAFTATIV